MEGRQLPSAILGRDIESYRVFACSGSTLEAVPFQIEEHDLEGRLLFRQGPEASKGDGSFGALDELIFMARDTGGPCRGPGPEGCSKTANISISDKAGGAEGFALIAQCEDPPALSPKDYVRMDIGARTVSGGSYRFGWQKAPVYYYDYISIGSGPDVLDRIKVRCSIGQWGVMYTFSEEDFHTKLVGYTDGPVRVSWRTENYWRLGPFGKIPSPQFITFYPEYIVDHNDLDMTLNPAVLGLDFVLSIGHDMALDAAEGYRLCANILPECLPILRIKPGDIESRTRGEIKWGGISGPDGAMITRLVKDPRLIAPAKYVFVYDPGSEGRLEYIKGSAPLIGFEFGDWRKVKPGVYDLTLLHYFFDKYSTGEIERFNRIVDNPLQLSAK